MFTQEAHPYEEPTFDVYERVATPAANAAGMGRIGALASPLTRQQLADHVKRALGLPTVLVVAPSQLGATTGKPRYTANKLQRRPELVARSTRSEAGDGVGGRPEPPWVRIRPAFTSKSNQTGLLLAQELQRHQSACLVKQQPHRKQLLLSCGPADDCKQLTRVGLCAG